MEKEYIKTIESGAGSYPEPSELKEKCYQFNFDASVDGNGIIYAENEEEAIDEILKGNYNNIDINNLNIENILSIIED